MNLLEGATSLARYTPPLTQVSANLLAARFLYFPLPDAERQRSREVHLEILGNIGDLLPGLLHPIAHREGVYHLLLSVTSLE